MKTQNVFKQGTLLILALFITSLVWSNGLSPEGNENDVETTEVSQSNIQIVEFIVVDGTAELLLTNDDLSGGGSNLTNFPDPFINKTAIIYQINQASSVSLKVYKGTSLKATLVSEFQVAGKYSVVWDATGLSSGQYIAMLITDHGSYIESMTKKTALPPPSGSEDN